MTANANPTPSVKGLVPLPVSSKQVPFQQLGDVHLFIHQVHLLSALPPFLLKQMTSLTSTNIWELMV